MDRDTMIRRIAEDVIWDLTIVGGGATGLSAAIDSAARGFQTLLVERDDFSAGTSSRSTKLVHGGVRYLQQGNIPLVMEALRERGILRRNAPHLVHDLGFVVPNYDWWEAPFYGVGMKVYDVLAGRHGLGHSRLLSKEETLAHLPTIETHGLRGGVLYFDGQFDDSRLAVHLARTAANQGAVLANYLEVTGIIKDAGMVSGLALHDHESGHGFRIRSRAVINATGVFGDGLRELDEPGVQPLISPSQGVHLVLDADFLPGDSAIMVPHTDDGRVLFAIPWHGKVVVGTTDTPLKEVVREPLPLPEEVKFLLTHAARYLTKDPCSSDVRSVFAGLRPLVGGGGALTAALSRDHLITISNSGLVTIAGGKWTTCRKMGQDVVNRASVIAGLPEVASVTENLNVHGYHAHADVFGSLAVHGSDAPAILELSRSVPGLAGLMHPRLPYRMAEVVWAARYEMARSLEDVLSRRTRALILDARAASEAAPAVAELLAAELGRDKAWADEQVARFRTLAAGYLLN